MPSCFCPCLCKAKGAQKTLFAVIVVWTTGKSAMKDTVLNSKVLHVGVFSATFKTVSFNTLHDVTPVELYLAISLTLTVACFLCHSAFRNIRLKLQCLGRPQLYYLRAEKFAFWLIMHIKHQITVTRIPSTTESNMELEKQHPVLTRCTHVFFMAWTWCWR